MIGLKKTQELFAKAVMAPLEKDEALLNKVGESIIEPTKKLTAGDRLGIYHRQYWYRLLDCLWEDFPGLRAVLGEKKFTEVTRAYLEKYPSRSFNLRNLGSKLPLFLSENRNLLGRKVVAAIDMATLEWAQVEAFDSEGRSPITPEEITKGFVLQPYIKLVTLQYPLDDFLIAVKKDEKKKVKLPKKEQIYLAVHRYQNSVHYKRLSSAEYALLGKIAEGAQLGEACETMAEILLSEGIGHEEIAATLKRDFESWSALGWFCKETVCSSEKYVH